MAEDVEVQGTSSFLLVKVSDEAGGPAAGKVFLIPENSLAQFELESQNEDDFAATLDDKLVNVDFAVFWNIMILRGSGA
jgi:hypothetical protein